MTTISTTDLTKQWARKLRTHFLIIGGIVAFLWLLELIDWLLLDGYLNRLGVRPRSFSGLEGILFAPFSHANFAHLAANTLPFAILGWLILVRGLNDFLVVTSLVSLSSALGAWLFGGIGTVHIGLSGVVFGYFGFLIVRAIYERSLAAISAALLVIFLYGSLIWGVFPLMSGVSWQMHLFGFIGGAVLGKWLARPPMPALHDDDENLLPDSNTLIITKEETDRYR